MEREAVCNFKGQRVKLTYHNGFNLIGIILEVYQKSILFETNQKKAAISLSEILSVVGGF